MNLESNDMDLEMIHMNGTPVHMDLGEDDMNLKQIYMNLYMIDIVSLFVGPFPMFHDPNRESGYMSGIQNEVF